MEASEENPSPLLAKCVAMVTLFTISLILGSLPMLIAKKFEWESNMKNNKLAQVLLAIGGGVLMATTFIHLLPEVSENAENIDQFKNLKFPVAETLTCLGFFLIYFVEECVHLYLHKHHYVPHAMRRSVSILRGEVYSPNKSENEPKISVIFDLDSKVRASQENQFSSRLSSARNSKDLIRMKRKGERHSHEMGHEEHSHLVGDEKFLGSVRGLLVVLALSVHEVMEGLSVGLERKPKNVWYMFAAVGAHKFIIAFCVGVELLSCGIKKRLIFIYVFTFAVVSPLGIAIGIAISSEGAASSEIPSVVMQGFATGTLVYVIFFEILKKSEMDEHGLMKYVAVVVGFLVMFFITVLLSDDEDDDD
ncbi:hypothetical protein HHI36_021028 [Cryptolaemus montrouzieri]|uniref:Uncharacterized protein n=1 Tax=Cryptolaemus montrouzieri TaxID=559131 RepID=A0ABD2MWC9_9CUCU